MYAATVCMRESEVYVQAVTANLTRTICVEDASCIHFYTSSFFNASCMNIRLYMMPLFFFFTIHIFLFISGFARPSLHKF